MSLIDKLKNILEEHNTSGEIQKYNKDEFPREASLLEGYIDRLNGVGHEVGIIIAGGALSSLFTNQEVNDIDIYFRDEEGFTGFLAALLDGDIMGYLSIVNLSDRSILLSDHKDAKLQLIYYKWFEKPEDIFKDFDFSVNMAAYDCRSSEFVFHKDFLKHNAQRHIEINTGTAFPITSVLRVEKYRRKGYNTSKSQLLRLLLRCTQLELNSWEDVISHCGGMYGINPKDLFDTSKEFSLESAIEQLANLPIPLQNFDTLSPSLLESINLHSEENTSKLKGRISEDLQKRIEAGAYLSWKPSIEGEEKIKSYEDIVAENKYLGEKNDGEEPEGAK